MISNIWNFVKDPSNRDVITWIGSGVVVVVGGLWAVFRFLLSKKTPAAPRTIVTADRGSTAAGRDVNQLQKPKR